MHRSWEWIAVRCLCTHVGIRMHREDMNLIVCRYGERPPDQGLCRDTRHAYISRLIRDINLTNMNMWREAPRSMCPLWYSSYRHKKAYKRHKFDVQMWRETPRSTCLPWFLTPCWNALLMHAHSVRNSSCLRCVCIYMYVCWSALCICISVFAFCTCMCVCLCIVCVCVCVCVCAYVCACVYVHVYV